MDSSLWFWAKLGAETWPDKYHPVLCHLIDVGVVARRLWRDVCRAKVRDWVAARLGLPNHDATGAWLAFWAALHDIGKVSPGFQAQGKTGSLQARLTDEGFCFAGAANDPKHGVISTVVLNAALLEGGDWPGVDADVARAAAVAVGGHHGVFPTNWNEIRLPLGNATWAAVRRELIADLARLFEVAKYPAPKPTSSDDQSVWMYVAGLTSVADWIGSNEEFFKPAFNAPLGESLSDVDAYFKKADGRAEEALEKLGWLGRAHTNEPITFATLFPQITKPRPLQEEVERIVNRMTEPGLLIVEAPMGEGKTEAGWYAAACWDRRDGQGAYVALPTMATSNQMFDRVAGFLEIGDGKKSLMLQHGKAALNEEFEKLKYKARLYDEDKSASGVVAEAWFASNKKHGLLAPYGVGTIDQALLAVLQTKHVFVRLFGLAGKCVILDEVHAYDAYMTTLMERLLRWLAALGCPVVLLSATLPKEKRLKLLRAYAGDDMLPEPEDAPYPRVTSWAVGDKKAMAWHITGPARQQTVKLGWLDNDKLAETLRQSLANGGCAAVIRNTVGLAQETYLQLRDAMKNDGIVVELFHARFPFGRRMEIENEVLKRFGKSSKPADRDKHVLVATQVIEQSLDLDFDVMISDAAPVDLVLQRAGRLHRHARGTRPAGVAEPRLWLVRPGEKDGLPDFGKPSEYVYARFVLLRSYLALQAVDVIRLPGDLEHLVEQVYGAKPLTIPDGWQAALDVAKEKWKEKQDNQQLNAMDVAISEPDQTPLEQQCLQLEDDNPEAAKKIQAQTRASDPNIQLIIIYHIGGRDYLDPGGLELFDEACEPNFAQVRRLLQNEITTSDPGCFWSYIKQPAPFSWRQKGMLRYHRIVRVDGKGQSLGKLFLRVDHQVGVVFKEC